LKPSNLLLNDNCFVKICDFGMARSLMDSIYVSAPVNMTEEFLTDNSYSSESNSVGNNSSANRISNLFNTSSSTYIQSEY